MEVIQALILVISLEVGVPPEFVMAIALTENSSLNPTATSTNVDGSVDRGIMQLSSRYFHLEDWADPVENIRIACEHIYWLAEQLYYCTWFSVAIAYNAGLSRVWDPPWSSVEYANEVMRKMYEFSGEGMYFNPLVNSYLTFR